MTDMPEGTGYRLYRHQRCMRKGRVRQIRTRAMLGWRRTPMAAATLWMIPCSRGKLRNSIGWARDSHDPAETTGWRAEVDWKRGSPAYGQTMNAATGNIALDYPQIVAELRTELSRLSQGRFEIGEDTDLLGDLALDSLQVMNLLLEIEDKFDVSIPVNILPDVKTVRDLALQIENLVREK